MQCDSKICCLKAFLKWIDADVIASLPFTTPTAQLSEEKAALTAAAETLKADVEFTKQQLHYDNVQVGRFVYALHLYCMLMDMSECVCVCVK